MTANLDLVRSMFDGWSRGDLDPTEWAHPDIEFEEPDGPEPRSFKGIEALKERIRDFVNAWDGWRIEAEVYRELDDGRVLVLSRVSGRGNNSGMRVAQARATLLELEDGRVVRYVTYWSRHRGLAAFGLDDG